MLKTLTSILVASILLVQPAFAAVPAYKLVKEKSTIKFFAIQNGAPVEGEFKSFSTDIHFDKDKLADSTVVVEVDVASVSAANGEVATTLVTPEWFSVKAFPKAVFKSKTISRMPNSNNYYAEGTLTLRGKTTPATLNFQIQFNDKTAIASGYLTVSRKDFGIGQGEWAKDDVVKNEVRVEFRITAEAQ